MSEEYKKKLKKNSGFSQENRQKLVEELHNLGSTIEEKNRSLRDICYLLSNNWKIDDLGENWCFTNIDKLVDDINKLAKNGKYEPEVTIQTNWNELLAKIEDAKQKTPHSYLELTEMFPATFSDVQKYIDWFYLYLPYLVTDIVPKENWSEAINRLNWFISKSPTLCPIEMLKSQAMEYLINSYS